MIKSFRHKGLKEFFETGRSKKIAPKHHERLRMVLTLLNAVTAPGQMAAPGLKYHPLVGPMKGLHAVALDGNTRVVWRMEGGHAYEVDYVDYH